MTNVVLPDILGPGLKVVFCGTAAGNASAKAEAYYAHPGNKFWPTLFRVGLTPQQLSPQEFRALPQYGIGLTDLAKHTFGADKKLRVQDFDTAALRWKIKLHQPWALAFDGKRAAQEYFGRRDFEYGLQPETIGNTAIFVLPATSGLAAKYWDESAWQALADWIKARENR